MTDSTRLTVGLVLLVSSAAVAQNNLSSRRVRYAPPVAAMPEATHGSANQPPGGSSNEVAGQQFPPAGGPFVVFAGGAVELRAPDGWIVYEIPFGREVRLVMSPLPLTGRRRMPLDGIWMTCHVDPPEQPIPFAKFGNRLAGEYGTLVSFHEADDANLSGSTGMRQAFSVGANGDTALGNHWLVRTDWGILEIVAIAPASQREARESLVQQLMATLKIGQPRRSSSHFVNTVHDAQPVLGAWKAWRSRLWLRENGRIVIQFDPRTNRPIDAAVSPEEIGHNTITGRFEASGDLLLATFDDGSRLNLRWRTKDGNLLLTDHEGQITLLRRLLN